MKKNTVRSAALSAFLITLVALPAVAQVTTIGSIPAGKDFWVTPDNAQTDLVFRPNDIETLCGVPNANGKYRVTLKGVRIVDSQDYDTVVARLDKAVFDAAGNASTRVQVQALNLASAAPVSTPCGSLDWTVRLVGAQAVTNMKLRRISATGGLFSADIAVNVELRATRAGTYVGSLFYNIVLPDPAAGTPWSVAGGNFRAGMSETNDCLDVLRQKLLTYDTSSDHFYFISDMIAQGQCRYKG